jgi:pullulanase/glycogen debranching enzyme
MYQSDGRRPIASINFVTAHDGFPQKRNFITTLMLSQGVSMLLGGDELSRTQQRNNIPAKKISQGREDK